MEFTITFLHLALLCLGSATIGYWMKWYKDRLMDFTDTISIISFNLLEDKEDDTYVGIKKGVYTKIGQEYTGEIVKDKYLRVIIDKEGGLVERLLLLENLQKCN